MFDITTKKQHGLLWLFDEPIKEKYSISFSEEIEGVDESVFYHNIEFVDRYSINEFIDVVILYNNDEDIYLYNPIEPDINGYESLLEELYETVRKSIIYRDDIPDETEEIDAMVERVAEKYIVQDQKISVRVQNFILSVLSKVFSRFDRYKTEISDKMMRNIIYYLKRDLIYNGKLQPLIKDSKIEDIHINGPNKPVYIVHSDYSERYNIMTSIVFNETELQQTIQSYAQESDKQISKSEPIKSGSLSDGSRVQLILSDEVNEDGSSITIRLFDDIPLTPVDLIKYDTMTVEMMSILWLLMENESSVMFAGGTGAGKTTTMNAVSMFIPPNMKIVSIEDTREIKLPHNNWVKHVTRESSNNIDNDITMFDLLESSLRERPEYIMVGEVRGKEAQTLFQAINTGHATTSTFHANNVKSVINRLTDDNIGVNKTMITGLDLIIIQKRIITSGDDIRRVIDMREIQTMNENSNTISSQSLFKYDDNEHQKQLTINESKLLQQIKWRNNYTEEQLQENINNKQKILQYLVDNDITEYGKVVNIIEQYYNNEKQLLHDIKHGDLS